MELYTDYKNDPMLLAALPIIQGQTPQPRYRLRRSFRFQEWEGVVGIDEDDVLISDMV